MTDDPPNPATSPSLLEILDLEDLPDQPDPDVSIDTDGVLVTGSDAQDDPVDLDRLCAIAAAVLTGEDVRASRIDIHLVDVETIAELNGEHMGAEGPTDVLAFPLEQPFGRPGEVTDDHYAHPTNPDISADALRTHLGDVVICPSVAIGQAAGHTGSIDTEFALLTIHGVLHVLGHDHAEFDERLVMQARERVHLGALGLDHPVPAPASENQASDEAAPEQAPASESTDADA